MESVLKIETPPQNDLKFAGELAEVNTTSNKYTNSQDADGQFKSQSLMMPEEKNDIYDVKE